jgi:hypothetical protein
MAEMTTNIAVVLMFRLLQTVIESGVNETEARCALRAAEALLPEAGLEPKPTMTVYLP